MDKIYTFKSNASGDMWVYGSDEVGSDEVVVVDAGGKLRSFKTGWGPTSWSPDGRSILVATDRRLGLMSPVDGTVREIGRLRSGTILEAGYLG